jgi:tRNA(Ile2) C34 agmatinyltransferase TiaS
MMCLKIEDAEKLASQLSIHISSIGAGLGIIGALASIGALLEGIIHTKPLRIGKKYFRAHLEK